ncbi:MAG: hypothetical protein IJU70_09940, partial [Lentisphaeria bacterium]|nr:hypothetical protein [Lentisphaeria bacterium]
VSPLFEIMTDPRRVRSGFEHDSDFSGRRGDFVKELCQPLPGVGNFPERDSVFSDQRKNFDRFLGNVQSKVDFFHFV